MFDFRVLGQNREMWYPNYPRDVILNKYMTSGPHDRRNQSEPCMTSKIERIWPITLELFPQSRDKIDQNKEEHSKAAFTFPAKQRGILLENTWFWLFIAVQTTR